MGERIYGHHAIEEGIKKAGMGSTLYVQRGGGEKIEALVREAQLTGKIDSPRIIFKPFLDLPDTRSKIRRSPDYYTFRRCKILIIYRVIPDIENCSFQPLFFYTFYYLFSHFFCMACETITNY